MSITTKAEREQWVELETHCGHLLEVVFYPGEPERLYIECMNCFVVLFQVDDQGEGIEWVKPDEIPRP